ncbi:MAG: DNA methyltransferase [Caldisericota bacterium]|nr:DNA methyltransferase [Caldisericota bacterium]
MDLFGSVLNVYAGAAQVTNEQLFSALCKTGALSEEEIHRRVPIGQSGELHSVAKRKVRWYQQTLKKLGLIEKVPGSRALWRAAAGLVKDGDLTPAPAGVHMVAFSTRLGVAIWGDCRTVFAALDEPIHLCITSPPYCLSRPRAYGNPNQSEYVDFICESLEPIVRHLVPGGSIALNVSNDIFMPGSPARSMYQERLLLALHDRLGLYKMDTLQWVNPSKAPGPIAWASKKRVQLNVGYEPIHWLTNDPHRVRSNNQRVLQPHSERHLKLIADGGEKRTASYGDGANRIRPGAFGRVTEGKIPRNVIQAGHRCAHQSPARAAAAAHGLPVHGAAMPFAVADFLVKFLSEEGDLVVDNFAGLKTSAEAAEVNGRRWVTSELHHEYAFCGSYRFEQFDGFQRNLSL